MRAQGWRVKAVLHLGLGREWALSGGLRCPSSPPVSSLGSWVPSPSHKSLLLGAELKKVVAQKPEGLKTLAEEFPGWEAAARWSQALEEVEQRSRPYLQGVQRYEKHRCPGAHGLGGGTGSPASQPHWARFPALIKQPQTILSICPLFSQDPLLLGPLSPPCLWALGTRAWGPHRGRGHPPPSH